MCKHERLRTVGHDVFCCECGEQLPLEFLLNKGKKQETPVEKVKEEPEKPARKPAAKKTTKKTEGK